MLEKESSNISLNIEDDLLISLKIFDGKWSISFNFLDKPNIRKIHQGEIPLIGGIVIYLNLH